MGFWTTFWTLARDYFSPTQMAWLLVKIFFGLAFQEE